MRIFVSARLRLTTWYLLIITFVAILFSIFIYRNITWQLQDSFRSAEMRLRAQTNILLPKKATLFLLADEYEKARHAVVIRLAVVNFLVIGMSGIAAYFMSGKTLKPLEDTIEEQKRFVADASHELRTPLTVLRSEIEVSLRDKTITTKQAKELLRSNLEEVEKMQGLTNYLLALSRYEAGNKKLQKEIINLSEIVNRISEKHKSGATQKEINLTTKTKNAFTKANKVSIEELVSILLDNAIKYTPKGGEIKITTSTLRRSAILTISDTGVGIKASEIPYIFNRFYRADSSRTKTQTDGYGLGLSIAKSIVGLHKGKIEVDSSPSKGTAFTVTFPLARS